MENSGMQMDTIKDNQAKLGLLTACLAIILVSGEKKIHRGKRVGPSTLVREVRNALLQTN